MASDEKKRPSALKLAPSRTSSSGSSSSSSSLKHPRTPRFAEATTVHSPIDGSGPFSDVDASEFAHSQPADVGFGYINNGESVSVPKTPKSPLKSAMKVPGTPARKFDNPLSPTFREEDILEKREQDTEKEQARDIKIKTRVRLAKFALRSVSFTCSLIVLSMISASLRIFFTTKELPAMNGLPAWASGTKTWPQIVCISAAAINLAICVLIFIGYCRGGHRRAEKVGVYYTLFAVGWFITSMIMWCAAAGILQFTKNNSNNKDLWGWSCVKNQREQLFSQKIDYGLVCTMQSWTVICAIIEILLEAISIALYAVIFYRYYSKRKLMKSMDMRDRARSDLYLAQLRTQSAPNTPGFGPKSPSFSMYSQGMKSPAFSQNGPKSPAYSQYALSPRFPPNTYKSLSDIEEANPFTPGRKFVEPQSAFAASASPKSGDNRPFTLQAPPKKAPSATPKLGSDAFKTPDTPSAPAAPGEQQYDAVAIPGAYSDAVKSPPARQTSFSRPR